MRQGHLSQYFTAVAIKRVRAVEANTTVSHQHEFNGVNPLRIALGSQRLTQVPATFIYVSDNEEEAEVEPAWVTWYDSREGKPRSAEYRLYFPSTSVSERMTEGDTLVVAKRPDGSIVIVVVEGGSSAENQILWLFGAAEEGFGIFTRDFDREEDEDRPLSFASRTILETLGIEIEEVAEDYLPLLLREFDGIFPRTDVFSRFARKTLGINSQDGPDAAIVAWMEREELLFRTLERHMVAERLQQGFGDDVDAFVSFSLSVQNRRKSRVGHALENHLQQVFLENGLSFSRGEVTENRARPDFVFPGIEQYRLPTFASARLSMLGVKTSCKDRWRQITTEAARIHEKHLLTLEPGISEPQTREMEAHGVRLVLPRPLHATYTVAQQQELLDLATFLELVRARQGR